MKKQQKLIWIFFALALVWIGISSIPVNSLISSDASSVSPTEVISIAAGEHHAVALRAEGTVWTWGSNFRGQLGNGEISPEGQAQATPSLVANLSGVTSIAAGSLHTLALKGDGTVWTWGDNRDGQLGTGTASNIPQVSPAVVPSLSDVVYIAAGGGHSIAVDKNGSVWIWGNNGNGQLADGTTTTRPAPVRASVPGAGIFAGAGSHTVFADFNGVLFTWGANDFGQLGNGTTVGSLTPASPGTPENTDYTGTHVTAVAAGGGYPLPGPGQNHSMALWSNGTVTAWGNNLFGQTGDGTADNTRPAPVQAASLSGVDAIAAGLHHSVALKTDGTVWSWGDNEFGELGNGTTTESNIPVQVTGIAGVGSLAARGDFTLALKKDGTVWAWGRNSQGELGDGTTIDRLTPVKVIGLDIPSYSISGQVTSGGAGLQGVTITLSGTASSSTTTDSAGNYTFTGLANGKYTVTPTVAGYSFTPQNQTADLNGTDTKGLDFTAASAGYAISGQVTNGGLGLPGVTISLSGATSGRTTTDFGGNYSFTGLANGKYTVTPTVTGYSFTPQNQTANVNGTDTKGLDFATDSAAVSDKTASAKSLAGASVGSISGQVTSGGAGLSGVTISLSGLASGSTTTDSGGNYSFTGLANGKYTITPTMAAYKFTPVKRSVTVKGANVTVPKLTATFIGYSISGQATSGGRGISGVAVSLSGPASKSTKTDSKGNYKFTVLPNGDYTITPAKTGYNFNPQSIAVNVNGNNPTGQNLTATFIGCSISGQVTSGGSGFPGVTISLSGAASGSTTTDSGGNYSFSGFPNGNYKITPSMAGYKFTPASRSGKVSGANVTGRNFTAASSGYAISGQVTNGGSGLSGVTMSLSGASSRSTATGSGGNYSFTGLAKGNYKVTPTLSGYSFTPQNQSANLTATGTKTLNFTATGSGGGGDVTVSVEWECHYGIPETLYAKVYGKASGAVGTEVRTAVFPGSCSDYDAAYLNVPDSCEAWSSDCVRTDTEPSESSYSYVAAYNWQPGQFNVSGTVILKDATTGAVLTSKCVSMNCNP